MHILPLRIAMTKNSDYSTKVMSNQLRADIETVLKDLEYGSVELYVTDSTVTHITKKQVKKTDKNKNK